MNRLKINKIVLDTDMKGHAHDHGQIMIPLQGSIFMKSENVEVVLDERTIVITPPGVVHYYNGGSDNQMLVIDFPKKLLKREDVVQLNDLQMFMVTDKLKQVKKLLLLEEENSTSAFALNYLFYYLYDLLLSKPLSPSIKYITENYDQPIAIKTLASMEHYSENYYREWFKKKTGMSPVEYIQRFRIEKAKELLISSKYAISDIAYQVGFSHQSSFTKAFRLVEEDSPSNYRKENTIGVSTKK